MACNNSLIKYNKSNKLLIIPTNIHFDAIFKKSPEKKWQYEDTKRRLHTLAKK